MSFVEFLKGKVNKIIPKHTIVGNFINEVLADTAEDIYDEMLPNQFNARQAELNRAFNADEAQKNRDFQQQQSETQYQRSVADMTASGVNPALMYGHATSNTSATGSVASGSNASASGSGFFSNMSAMMSTLLTKANISKTIAETKYIQSQERNVSKNTEFTQKQIEFYSDKIKAEINKLQADTTNTGQLTTESKKRVQFLSKELSWYDALKSVQISQISSDVDLKDATRIKLETETTYIPSQMKAQIQLLLSQNESIKANIDNLEWATAKTISFSEAENSGWSRARGGSAGGKILAASANASANWSDSENSGISSTTPVLLIYNRKSKEFNAYLITSSGFEQLTKSPAGTNH